MWMDPVHGLRREGQCGPPAEPVLKPPWPRPPRPRSLPEEPPPVVEGGGRDAEVLGEGAGAAGLVEEEATRAEGDVEGDAMLSSARRRSVRT
jgi:hypothetical protein